MLIVARSGSYTTTVLGNLNRIGGLASSLYVFQNPISSIQLIGFVITFSGIGFKLSLDDEVRTDESIRIR